MNDVPCCKECDRELIDDEEDYCVDCQREFDDADEGDRAYERWKERQLEIEYDRTHPKEGL